MSSINKIILLSGRKFLKISSNSCSRSVSSLAPKLKGNMSDAVTKLNRRKNLFSRTLSKKDWQNVESVTAVSTAFSSVSWSTILLPSFKLTSWDLYDLNYTEVWDTDFIRTANDVKEKLPISDLYVMETAGLLNRTKVQHAAEMGFRCFLITLLDIQNGTLENSNLILQRPNVLNSLRNLTVGGERTSCKNVIFNELMKGSHQVPAEDPLNPFLLLKIEKHMLGSFSALSENKQEKLALALLLNLSFLNLAYLQNPNSIVRMKNSKSECKGNVQAIEMCDLPAILTDKAGRDGLNLRNKYYFKKGISLDKRSKIIKLFEMTRN